MQCLMFTHSPLSSPTSSLCTQQQWCLALTFPSPTSGSIYNMFELFDMVSTLRFSYILNDTEGLDGCEVIWDVWEVAGMAQRSRFDL
ncbi:hypothetical protein EV363DRAFT_1445955 [Boletus edulis]|nr:hypothetical protein EV363DRAFT_1445955 [Boletus edulis]